MTETADVVVVGLGAVGAAALHRLALAGARTVGIDRFRPPHAWGSSHGESRITRLAVGEGPAYAPLVRRSHAIWRELEARTNETLMLQTGGLIMGPKEGGSHHGKDDFVRRSARVARESGVAVEVLEAAEIGRRFPQFILRGDELACYEPTAGVLFPERCIEVQLRLAEAEGARIHVNETVLAVEVLGDGVQVRTDKRTVQAGRAILAAGPWLPALAGGTVPEVVRVHRQTLHWFPAEDPAAYAPDRFPVFIWMHGSREADYFYGFPCLPGTDTVKVATEQYAETYDPDTGNRDVRPAESAALYADHVRGRLRGIGGQASAAKACLYAVTPDSGFILDRLQDRPGILVASACSGHGFKHSAAVGEHLAAAALQPGQAAASFALDRWAASAVPA